MIDTAKYEGHTPTKQWKVNQYCEESLGIFYLVGTTNPNRVHDECLHCGSQRDGLSHQVHDGRMSKEEWEKLCERDSVNQQLMSDAPLLLEEVKRLREVIDKEHPTFDWSSRQTIAKLDAEVKRLREDNELYLACINASHFRDKPGSALSKRTQMRFLQRGEEE